MATRKSTAKPVTPATAPATSNYPVIKDKAVIAAAEEYAKAGEAKKAAELRLKQLKPTLLAAMGDAPMAYAGTRVLSRTEVASLPGTPNRPITREMIGQVIPGEPGKAGYTQLRVQ